ncbi:MAG TPA: AraC family ligand binding domain-containing protein [Polyangiaceae bacterium]|nr:AraC family ligand binding domain-containing protein [Polyangiaceae bacterium]
MTKPTAAAGGAAFDLAAIDREMRGEPAYLREGHTARTLVREPDLRIVLLAMQAGAHLAEHRADETSSIQALRGQGRLRLPDKLVNLPSGHLLVLERGLRHDLEALEESTFLLTIGWQTSR